MENKVVEALRRIIDIASLSEVNGDSLFDLASAAIPEAEAQAKDTERLDWREAHPNHGFGLYADGMWTDASGWSHKTYREAIDAAMKQRPSEGEAGAKK